MSSALINDRTHHLREVLGEGVEVMRQGTLSSSPTHFQAKRFRIDKPADRFAEPINVVVRRHEPFDAVTNERAAVWRRDHRQSGHHRFGNRPGRAFTGRWKKKDVESLQPLADAGARHRADYFNNAVSGPPRSVGDSNRSDHDESRLARQPAGDLNEVGGAFSKADVAHKTD